MAQAFIIAFTARSGSTALLGNLRAAPGVVMRAEVFGNRALPDFGEQTDDNRIKFLRRYWAPFKGEQPAADAPHKGFKFQIDAKDTQFGQPRRLAKVMKEYRPKVIVLRRQNVVKQAISSLNARRLKAITAEAGGIATAHVTEDDRQLLTRLTAEKLTVDPQQLKTSLNTLKKAYRKLDDFVGNFDDRLEIRYEDYLQDRDACLTAVFDYLGIDVAPDAVGDAYVKITDDDLQRTVKNYEALRRFASGTEYEAMV